MADLSPDALRAAMAAQGLSLPDAPPTAPPGAANPSMATMGALGGMPKPPSQAAPQAVAPPKRSLPKSAGGVDTSGMTQTFTPNLDPGIAAARTPQKIAPIDLGRRDVGGVDLRGVRDPNAEGEAGRVEGVHNPMGSRSSGPAMGAEDWKKMAEASMGIDRPGLLRAQSADKRALDAKGDTAQLAFQNGQDSAAYAEGVANQYQTMQQRQAIDAQHRQSIMQAQAAKVQQVSDLVSRDKIDPNRMWGHASTASKVVAILGAALSGLGAALSHTKDQSVEAMNAAINRDIDVQRANIENHRKGVEDARGLYTIYRQQGLDDAAAADAARADYLKYAVMKGDALAQRSGSKILQSQWGEQKAAFEAQLAHAGVNMNQAINAQAFKLQYSGHGNGDDTKSLDKYDEDNANYEQAVRNLSKYTGGDVAGFDKAGRAANLIDGIFHTNLQSAEAKQARRDVATVEAHNLKASGSRVNPVSQDRASQLVRDSDDVNVVTSLAAENIAKARENRYKDSNKKSGRSAPRGMSESTDVGEDKD